MQDGPQPPTSRSPGPRLAREQPLAFTAHDARKDSKQQHASPKRPKRASGRAARTTPPAPAVHPASEPPAPEGAGTGPRRAGTHALTKDNAQEDRATQPRSADPGITTPLSRSQKAGELPNASSPPPNTERQHTTPKGERRKDRSDGLGPARAKPQPPTGLSAHDVESAPSGETPGHGTTAVTATDATAGATSDSNGTTRAVLNRSRQRRRNARRGTTNTNDVAKRDTGTTTKTARESENANKEGPQRDL